MFEKLSDYLVERLGVAVTIYFGVPILLVLASIAMLGFFAGVIELVAFAEQHFGEGGKTFVILWTAWTLFFAVFWWMHNDNNDDRGSGHGV